MIRTDELRGIIAKRGMSQRKVADAIGITEKTFYEKMKKGVFRSDEIEKMISLLEIPNPSDIFFARE
jgi:DNA-binding XRE family transcriptional regulator